MHVAEKNAEDKINTDKLAPVAKEVKFEEPIGQWKKKPSEILPTFFASQETNVYQPRPLFDALSHLAIFEQAQF